MKKVFLMLKPRVRKMLIADTPTAIKEPLAAETEIEHDGEALEEKVYDERDDESRNDEKNGRHEGSRTQGNV